MKVILSSYNAFSEFAFFLGIQPRTVEILSKDLAALARNVAFVFHLFESKFLDIFLQQLLLFPCTLFLKRNRGDTLA